METKTILNKLESLNEPLNLTHYWIIVLKYKRLLLIVPLLFCLLGYLIALNIMPIFKSSATIVIEKQEKRIVDIEEVYNAQARYADFNHVNNQIQIIKSDEIFNGILLDEERAKKIRSLYNDIPQKFVSRNILAIKKLISPIIKFKKISKGDLASDKAIKKYIKGNFYVAHIRNSDVVNLSFTSHDPELAKYILTELIESFVTEK